MIKKLFIREINELVVLDKPLVSIRFTDPVAYRNFIFNLDDNLILSINDSQVNFQTKSLIISNPLNIEINDKKTLTSLYKKLTYRISDNIRKQIVKVENDVFDLIEMISMESDCMLEYADSFDIVKILQMYQVAIKEVKKEIFLEFILTYIKINFELNNYCIVLSFGLTQLLTEEEIIILKNELAINQICIVDFYFNNNNPQIDYLTIDNEWNKI